MTSFLQSAGWQEVQERSGRQTFRVGGVLLIRHDLPFGFHYLYAPRPSGYGADFLRDVATSGVASGAVFVKVDPAEPLLARATHASLRPAHALQPRETILVDCSVPETALLAAMHSKTRYNIRLAERKGVRVRSLEGEEAGKMLHRLWPLFVKTATRDQFSLHPREHYEALLLVRDSDFSNELFVGELDGEPLVAAIINWFGPAGNATYLHGASARNRR